MKLFYGGYSTYHLDERYYFISTSHNAFSYFLYIFSISLNPLRPINYGMDCPDSGSVPRSGSDTNVVTSDNGDPVKMTSADTNSGFEVEVAPSLEHHHDWLSESGMSEETPLFSGSDKRSPSSRVPVPEDKMRRVWLVFYMLGMTTLLPWNFFIAVNDYWNFKFRDIEHNATHTQLQKEFTSYLGRQKKNTAKLNLLVPLPFQRYLQIYPMLSLLS